MKSECQDTDQLRVLLPLNFHRQQLVFDRRLPFLTVGFQSPRTSVLILTVRAVRIPTADF
jgi:hypothetical protein